MTKLNNIFIKNVYYMLAYAFQSLKQEQYENVDKESFDEIYDLFAAILGVGIGLQIKQGLYREYINLTEDMKTLRGKIDMSGTAKKMISHERTLVCNFDELSDNNLLNQILKSTVMLLLRNAKVKSTYKDDLKKKMLYFSNVETLDLKSVNWSSIRFQRNNQNYRMLIGICHLIVEGMLITTDKGDYKLASFIDEQRMCSLYQNFILGYYRKEHPEIKADALQIPWVLGAEDIKDMLPIMQTDITLRSKSGDKTLIIDAKYYSHNTQAHFGKNTIHSGNLYQIFTYVKNMEARNADKSQEIAGMLLYAKTEDQIQPDSVFHMSGNIISVKTLDLNQDFSEISKALDNIANSYFAKAAV